MINCLQNPISLGIRLGKNAIVVVESVHKSRCPQNGGACNSQSQLVKNPITPSFSLEALYVVHQFCSFALSCVSFFSSCFGFGYDFGFISGKHASARRRKADDQKIRKLNVGLNDKRKERKKESQTPPAHAV